MTRPMEMMESWVETSARPEMPSELLRSFGSAAGDSHAFRQCPYSHQAARHPGMPVQLTADRRDFNMESRAPAFAAKCPFYIHIIRNVNPKIRNIPGANGKEVLESR